MLTKRTVGRDGTIDLGNSGASIRVVKCSGNFVTLQVIAPPTVVVRLVEDVLTQQGCDEVQNAPRPNPPCRLD